MNIDANQLAVACSYIEKQFAAHSWWPKEQPGQAQHEYALMRHDPAALGVWCEKWLDTAQRRKLQAAID